MRLFLWQVVLYFVEFHCIALNCFALLCFVFHILAFLIDRKEDSKPAFNRSETLVAIQIMIPPRSHAIRARLAPFHNTPLQYIPPALLSSLARSLTLALSPDRSHFALCHTGFHLDLTVASLQRVEDAVLVHERPAPLHRRAVLVDVHKVDKAAALVAPEQSGPAKDGGPVRHRSEPGRERVHAPAALLHQRQVGLGVSVVADQDPVDVGVGIVADGGPGVDHRRQHVDSRRALDAAAPGIGLEGSGHGGRELGGAHGGIVIPIYGT
mmetsp:Transcript_10270/g.24504  ORF Transcript_10270/g.24504 Transcript_10270/m.24504 type:complete len:267 (+) Transcript_10270:69-869(+)